MLAYAPYVIIVAVLSLAQWGPIKDALDGVTKEIDWPGLNVVNADGEEPAPSVFKFNWLITPGTLLLVSGLLTDARAADLARRGRCASTARRSTSSSGRR